MLPGPRGSMELGPPSWAKMLQKLVNPWSVQGAGGCPRQVFAQHLTGFGGGEG